MVWYSAKLGEVMDRLGADMASGLTREEAARRLRADGPNRLHVKKGKSLLKKFAEQLADFMILVLLAAALISFVISVFEGKSDFIDPILILAVVVVNALMGIVQESRAEKAIDSLQKLSAPKSKVLRSGQQETVDSEALVQGDIVLFEAGDWVTADARLITAYGLRVEESSLTGESVPVDKEHAARISRDAALGERLNMVYSGSTISAGRCTGVVVAIGMDTEVGRIASLLHTAQPPETPLQKRLASMGKVLGTAALIFCAFIFLLGVINQTSFLDSFMLAVSLAVAAVPEGLPAIVTIALALGVQRMARKNAIVRKLPAVETLGSATVICSDKTGTLTQNNMTVQALLDAGGKMTGSSEKNNLLLYGSLCTNVRVEHSQEGAVLMGDPTEIAIVRAALDSGLSKTNADLRYPRVMELPFDSNRKRMTTVQSLPEGGYAIVTKGAPDVLIKLCTNYELAGQGHRLDGQVRKRVQDYNEELAGQAMRVIAVAYRKSETLPMDKKTMESDLTFLGLIGMVDPPRPEVKEAVRICKRAGIRPVMITGDHVLTAAAIARDIGILTGNKKVITGRELDEMSDDALSRNISAYSVFARVSPEHKSRVVRAYQSKGEIVAMTGDGVNDAPALKIADIGCAMGKTGTDVARDASDMILTDDNFSTIVEAIKEGRGIYQNICKTVHFLLSSNIGEILAIFATFIIGRESPLLPIQLLWINLVTDSLPALALGSEKADSDIMDRKPLNPKSSMFGGGRGVDILVQGAMIGLIALLAYETGIRAGDHTLGRTYAFAVLSLSQLVHAFNVRSDHSLFKIGFFSNRDLVLAFIICCAMQIAVICLPPMSSVFGTTPLTLAQWRTVALFSLIPLVAVELGKLIFRDKGERPKSVKTIYM